MDVVLSPEMERFVQEKVKSGQFGSPSDVIDGALSVLRTSEQLTPEALEELRAEIRHGLDQLDRGEGRPWDIEELKSRLHQKLSGANGKP